MVVKEEVYQSFLKLGLKSGNYTYVPQFLRRNVSLGEIEDRILNE
jgi:hypothetical protein